MTNKYDDIINLPHHVSKVHPQMSMQARAAQFAPFAALTGYDDAIAESERIETFCCFKKKCYLCVVKFDELHMRDKVSKPHQNTRVTRQWL